MLDFAVAPVHHGWLHKIVKDCGFTQKIVVTTSSDVNVVNIHERDPVKQF